MRVSVVINTYNRGPSLNRTLESLRHQICADFEVIVVNGPSTDETDEVLARWSNAIRRFDLPERNLGKSRNIGIRAAAGEIVAFIDDDSVPEPDWLEALVAAYDSPRVAGAGGMVFDQTGTQVQFLYSLCDRTGQTRFDVKPPLGGYLGRGADPFLYLQGTNCSFRRTCLAEIHGFDEECEYMYDEVEVCLRLVDLGYELVAIPGAAVHHKRLSSDYRTASGVALDPYPAIKNRVLFALRHGRGSRSTEHVLAGVREYVAHVKSSADACLREGSMTHRQHERFLVRADQGFKDGAEKASSEVLVPEPIGPSRPEEFLQFPTLQPEGSRMRILFVSDEYPPGYFGGIGRYTKDLSTGLAARGHEVHVVTPGPEESEVQLEEGVWVHRVQVQDRDITGINESPVRANWLQMAALYHEVCTLHELRPLDIVSAPLWNCTSLMCSLDDRFPTVTTLTTSLRTIAALHPSWAGSPHLEATLRLEELTARSARYVQAISRAIASEAEAEFGKLGEMAEVIQLGVPDRRSGKWIADPEEVNLLFVGRLERRKGVDLLLAALPELLIEYPRLRATIAGASTPNTELGETYQQRFQRMYAGNPAIASRVAFPGQLEDEALFREYEMCDIFCAPSRFESLGLVVIEAMMMGKPIVSSAVGGLIEVVEPVNGILVPTDDADALKDALQTLVQDRELRRTMGKQSRALYDSFWNLDAAVERTVAGFRGFAEHFARFEPTRSNGLVLSLAAVVERVEEVSAAEAEKIAGALIDSAWYPVDYRSALRRLWSEPDEKFVAGLYGLFLHRKADPLGMQGHLSRLRFGLDRAALVNVFASSPEGTAKGIDYSWLPEIESWPQPAGARTFTRRLSSFMVRRARRTMNAARSFRSRDTRVVEQLHELTESVAAMDARLGRLEAEAAAEDTDTGEAER